MNQHYLSTPVGQLQLLVENSCLVAICFPGRHRTVGAATDDHPVLAQCAAQLEEYFEGRRRNFDLPLAAAGTAFQQSVWRALAEIPYGELRSYRDIARRIGKPTAVRAVGAANGRNPLPIVVPCHRVIGSNGNLTGFAGGLGIKQQLLELEGTRTQGTLKLA